MSRAALWLLRLWASTNHRLSAPPKRSARSSRKSVDHWVRARKTSTARAAKPMTRSHQKVPERVPASTRGIVCTPPLVSACMTSTPSVASA